MGEKTSVGGSGVECMVFAVQHRLGRLKRVSGGGSGEGLVRGEGFDEGGREGGRGEGRGDTSLRRVNLDLALKEGASVGLGERSSSSAGCTMHATNGMDDSLIFGVLTYVHHSL
jgi:hypothetical protein